MVYTGDIAVWEPNESNSEKKFQKAVTVCKDFSLNVNLHKCVVMNVSQKIGGMEKIKCNKHEIRNLESSEFLGSKI
jgi:hypothetical protein